ncbi:MAG: GntR family transcriptional regulator [Candidatus Rokubacteria bacterium]|nr:GntR family transcriptional regulator [Candidatus Rokubacteria bacterium]
MRLRLNRKSALPIYVQLQAQLLHLIQTGHWTAGTRLPTVRQLAGTLRINRNTASKVFAELERAGYLSCEPGRGTFVCPLKAAKKTHQLRELLAMMDEATGRARRLGLAPAELAAALYARTASGGAARLTRVAVLFVECNRPRLRRLGAQLAEALPVRVDSLLIEDLRRTVRRSPASLRRYALVATTFFHIREVRMVVAKSGIEAVGVLAHASQPTLMRLAALPAGTTVGVTDHVKRSVSSAGLTHLRLVSSSGHGSPRLRRMLKKASVVVCSSPLARRLRAMASKSTEILVDDWSLDRAGIEMIRRRLSERAARNGGPRGSNARR